MMRQEDYKVSVRHQSSYAGEETTINLKFVQAVAGDCEISSEEQQKMEQMKRACGERYYSDLLFALTNQHYPHESAQVIWEDIQHHKTTLQSILGRRVGITVAALDYMATTLQSVAMTPTKKTLAYTVQADELTGLSSRSDFEASLESEIQKYLRYGNEVSLILLSIDDFNLLNLKIEPSQRDEIWARTGLLLRRKMREIDVATHYSSNKFAVVLPQTDFPQAQQLAEKLRTSFSLEFRSDYELTSSFGIANCPKQAMEIQSLIEATEQALYSAQHPEENQVMLAAC